MNKSFADTGPRCVYCPNWEKCIENGQCRLKLFTPGNESIKEAVEEIILSALPKSKEVSSGVSELLKHNKRHGAGKWEL